MNLIRNTLLAVLILQFIGFLYVKLFHTKKSQKMERLIVNQKRSKKIVTPKKIVLPTSIEYTDNEKVVVKKQTKILTKIAKIKPIKKVLKTKIKHKSKNKKIKLTKVIKKHIPKPTKKIHKKIKPKPKVRLSTKIEKYAKKMLGKKYVWGATGPRCYDCSGFTQKVYRKVAGVKLPRVSYLQAKVGKRISFKKLKAGDMVFFDTEKKRTGRVNHVGIYLRNGNFIHASSGGKKVMITNFRKKRFYRNRFLWGRRVIREDRTFISKSSLKRVSSKS